MKKISVIIPVYNAEKTLEKCVESVEKNKANLELILVNDGSIDGSDKIIQKLKEKYSNIQYIKKENGGLSDARNIGIEKATGDYISFVDSDDYIDEELYKNLACYMEQDYDLIKFRINTVDESGKIIKQYKSEVFEKLSGEEAFNLLFSSDEMLEPSCGYIYNLKFWNESKFKFAKGLYHEDFGLTPLVIIKAKKVASIDFYGYNYVQTSNSITRGNNNNLKRALDLIVHYNNMIIFLNQNTFSKKTAENIKIYYTNCLILKANELTGKDKEIYINKIKKMKLHKNIKARNLKQLIKKAILSINISLYLKIK